MKKNRVSLILLLAAAMAFSGAFAEDGGTGAELTAELDPEA